MIQLRNTAPVALALLLAIAPGAQAEQAVITEAEGNFDGRSGHSVSGSVSIIMTDSGHRVVLHDDFRLDSAPDPRLALGHEGYRAATQFAKLVKNSGRQVYSLPEGIDPSDYNEVWLWCEAFSVPLGVARVR